MQARSEVANRPTGTATLEITATIDYDRGTVRVTCRLGGKKFGDATLGGSQMTASMLGTVDQTEALVNLSASFPEASLTIDNAWVGPAVDERPADL